MEVEERDEGRNKCLEKELIEGQEAEGDNSWTSDPGS